MKFNNIQNKVYKTEDGPIWHSRSCAIVAHVYCFLPDDTLAVLIGKRGPKGDMPGLWNLPCGYMDWNENLKEALIREVFEETGLYLNGYEEDIVYGGNQPFFVNSDPNENRQNIAMHTIICFHANELPALTNENAELGEVDELNWISFKGINDEKHLLDQLSTMKFAFNHDKMIHRSFNELF